MWDLPGPGMETKSPALAGGFFPTGPPGKPYVQIFYGLQRPFIPTFAESPSLAVPMLSTTKWSLGDNVDNQWLSNFQYIPWRARPNGEDRSCPQRVTERVEGGTKHPVCGRLWGRSHCWWSDHGWGTRGL